MPQTLKQAAAAARISQLDAFGSSKGAFIIENELEPIEISIGEFIKRVHLNLQAEDMIVSGKINDIVIQKKGNTIEILANPELKFQDKGVNGSKVSKYNTPYSYKNKKPPVAPFIEWVEKRGLTSTEGETAESIAYAIRETVYQEGFKPRNVYTKEIPKLIDDVAEGLSGLIVTEIIRKL